MQLFETKRFWKRHWAEIWTFGDSDIKEIWPMEKFFKRPLLYESNIDFPKNPEPPITNRELIF